MNNLLSILKSKKGRLMVIFPHPDDETVATGGLLLTANKLGWRTIVVTLTKGDAGKCFVNKHGKTLSQIRSEELKKATNLLKVDRLVIGNFKDAKLKGSKEDLKNYAINVIQDEKPDIIVTYDHSGFTGHPDHIQLSVSVLGILKGLHKKIDLYWVSAPKFLANLVFNKETIENYVEPTDMIFLGFNILTKIKACLAHKSQDVGSMNILLYLYLAIFHREWYYKVDLKKTYKYKFVDFKI